MANEARSIGSLTISFGLVAIPVKLYSSTVASERISFNLLHVKDGSRLKQQYICLAEGKVVDRSEMVKGYEFAKDQYVTFTAEEIKALEEAGSDAIDISEFVPLESVDPLYFDRTYYLTPDRGGAKPYSLLAKALLDTKRCGVGRWAARGREHIVIVRPIGKGLAMHQLHFHAEVRGIEELGFQPAEIKDAELKLARQIIEQQTAAGFDPSSYIDEVKGRVEAAVQRKVEGRQISISNRPAAQRSDNVVDLMAALRASLDSRASASSNLLKDRKPPRSATRRSSRG